MKKLSVLMASMLLSGAVLAEGVKVNGTITVPMQKPLGKCSDQRGCAMAAMAPLKTIKLLKVEFSADKNATLHKQLQHAMTAGNATPATFHTSTPRHKQLGMGNVPVLNQGAHGSCVTFASTAAIDAALGMGDGISQLCQLQLGSFLEENGYMPSGWEGSFGPVVLHQMQAFGIVTKSQQMAHGCANYYQYPTYDEAPRLGMSLYEFHKIAEPLPEKISWSPVLHVEDAFEADRNPDAILAKVKASIDKNDRLTFGVLLISHYLGTVGATGTVHKTNDTWVLSEEVVREFERSGAAGGHEMVITGYDDSAVAVDAEGNSYKGLLTLRNSWGKDTGDNGNFYMSYDYFKMLTMEVQRIRTQNEG